MKKRYFLIIFFILTFIFVRHLIKLGLNKIFITNYNKGNYNEKIIKTNEYINMFQPYIIYYNVGNSYYRKGNYNLAIQQYNISLKNNPPKRKICAIRVNLALAMLQSISDLDDESINSIQAILYQDGCAKKGQEKGKDQKSDQIEEKLEKQKNNPSNSDKKPTEEKQSKPDEDDEDDSLEEKVKKEIEEAAKGREQENASNSYISGSDYYDGKKW